ncbi:TAXI family TRAP transporter solute-binding subunit [Streptomyces sp. NPDC006349]|uniref:TAXI family TRAP transporter solute-binding subunit n=1 Tax=Streptomyces sp. NPDC006349 TaxID=3156757 RepID=UPI0033BD841E
MNRRTALRAVFGTAAAGALGGVLAGDLARGRSGPSGLLRLATGEPTAFYAAFGRLLAAQLEAAHPGITCRVRTTAGSITNIALLRDGEADLGLVLTDTARAAARGTALFPRPVPLRAIGRVYETYLQFAVRADAPVHSVADLAGHPVSLGAVGSGAAHLGDRLLGAAGLTPGTVPVRHLRLADAAAALRTGSVVGLLVAGGVPLPTLSDLDRDPGLRFLPLAGLLRGLAGGRDGMAAAGLEEVTLPQSAYRASAGVATVGVSNLLVCRPDLDPAVAGALTRLLVRRAPAFVPDHAVGAQFLDVRSLIGTGGVPLHPGAAAAYRALHG